MQQHEYRLIKELRHLSSEQDQVRQSYARASEEAFAEIWNNEEDAIYDALSGGLTSSKERP